MFRSVVSAVVQIPGGITTAARGPPAIPANSHFDLSIALAVLCKYFILTLFDSTLSIKAPAQFSREPSFFQPFAYGSVDPAPQVMSVHGTQMP